MKVQRLIKLTLMMGIGASILFSYPAATFAAEASQAKPFDFTGVAKKSLPAVVAIKVKMKSENSPALSNSQTDLQEQFWQRFFGAVPKQNNSPEITLGLASGFIVSPDGHILTNAHVVQDATEIGVKLTDGRDFTAKVIGQDPNTDIALIKIDAKNLPYLKLANSHDLEVGQWVVAIGNPLGLQGSLTAGVVSAKGRNNLDLSTIEDFIQTDAAINRGNSGGPLLNLDSQVVGINTAIVANAANGGYMGIGFSIPSNIAKHIMDQLLAYGKVNRGYIGVILQSIDQDLAASFGLPKPEGALVAEVGKDTPAEKAGIKQGDVIMKYNNIPVTNIGELRNAVALMNPGSNITLSLLRDGKPITLTVQIGDFSQNMQEKVATQRQETNLGITVENITPELSQALGLNGEKGIVITKVNPNSPAAWAGLKKGALVIAVNQQKVTSVDQFNSVLKDNDNSKPILLLIKQGDSMRFVSFKLNG